MHARIRIRSDGRLVELFKDDQLIVSIMPKSITIEDERPILRPNELTEDDKL